MRNFTLFNSAYQKNLSYKFFYTLALSIFVLPSAFSFTPVKAPEKTPEPQAALEAAGDSLPQPRHREAAQESMEQANADVNGQAPAQSAIDSFYGNTEASDAFNSDEVPAEDTGSAYAPFEFNGTPAAHSALDTDANADYPSEYP